MDNTILYTAQFTHYDLKFHKVWWKSDKRCGSWFGETDIRTNGQTDRQTDRPIHICPQTMIERGIIIFLMGLTDHLKIGVVCQFKMKYVHLVPTVLKGHFIVKKSHK